MPSKCRPAHFSSSTAVARQSASREYAILGEYVRVPRSRYRATVTWVLTCLTRCSGAFAALPHRPPCVCSQSRCCCELRSPAARAAVPPASPPSPTFAVVTCVRCCAVMFLVPPSSRRHNFERRPVSVTAIEELRQRQYVWAPSLDTPCSQNRLHHHLRWARFFRTPPHQGHPIGYVYQAKMQRHHRCLGGGYRSVPGRSRSLWLLYESLVRLEVRIFWP